MTKSSTTPSCCPRTRSANRTRSPSARRRRAGGPPPPPPPARPAAVRPQAQGRRATRALALRALGGRQLAARPGVGADGPVRRAGRLGDLAARAVARVDVQARDRIRVEGAALGLAHDLAVPVDADR